MAMTNRGAYLLYDVYFRGASAPTTFYLALVSDTPTVDTNTLGELTEIAAANGYTSGGIAVARNSTDFDSLTETDATDLVALQIKDLTFTGDGGTLPSSGNALHAVLTDDNATVGSRQVIAFWSLEENSDGGKQVSDGQTLTLVNLQIDGDTVP